MPASDKSEDLFWRFCIIIAALQKTKSFYTMVGAIFGGVLFIVVVVFFGIYIWKRRRRGQDTLVQNIELDPVSRKASNAVSLRQPEQRRRQHRREEPSGDYANGLSQRDSMHPYVNMQQLHDGYQRPEQDDGIFHTDLMPPPPYSEECLYSEPGHDEWT